MTKQRLSTNDYYSTFDLALATAISLWYPLEALDRTQNLHKAQFLFKRDEQLAKLIETYWRGELKVNPQEYFGALKNIKSRLYEAK